MHRNRKLNRLEGYDYSRNALYFVTSCVEDRVCCFGEIQEGAMVLNEYGKIAERQLDWLEEQYPYVDLHAAVVMPNHIHAIIEINNRTVSVGTGRDLSIDKKNDGDVADHDESMIHDERLDGDKRTGRDLSLPGTKIKSLSQLMGAYKTTSSKQIHLAGLPTFNWQRSFHDHIIRNEESYFRISNYILANPSNWKDDKFHNQ